MSQHPLHTSGVLVAHDDIRALVVAQLHSFRRARLCEKMESDVKFGPPTPRDIQQVDSMQELADA